VTVRNATAFVTPGQVQLMIDVPGTWKMTPSGCTLVPHVQPTPCLLPAIAKHASRTVTVTLTAPAGNLDAQCHLFVSSVTSNGLQYPDVNPAKGATNVPVTKA
jgi:hypothetical protein